MDSRPLTLSGRKFELFITEQEIQNKVQEIAGLLRDGFQEKNPLFIGVMNGSFRFASDLLRHARFPCGITFVRISSYLGARSSGAPVMLSGPGEEIMGRDVIVLEDIVDSGATLRLFIDALVKDSIRLVKIVSLFAKPAGAGMMRQEDIIGFRIEDVFVAGYGMDYLGEGRELNDVYRME